MTRLTGLAALVFFVVLAGATSLRADPMKCSGEEKTCQLTCAKVPTASKSACLTECGVRKSGCMRTGCWDNGRQRYCGLSKQ